MQTQTAEKIGPKFPKSPTNPTGYTTDERERRLTEKNKEGARGRKDAGQEAVIKLESLTTKVDHLIKLHVKAEEAAQDFKDGVKSVAEAAGLLAATVAKYVKARAGDSDKFDDQKTKALQLALVFEEVEVDAKK